MPINLEKTNGAKVRQNYQSAGCRLRIRLFFLFLIFFFSTKDVWDEFTSSGADINEIEIQVNLLFSLAYIAVEENFFTNSILRPQVDTLYVRLLKKKIK